MTNHECIQPAANRAVEPIRTLVVDDSPRWMETLCAFLGNEPALVIGGTARDGIEALGRVATLQPALILLDVRMPRMDGLETAALIRVRFPEMRILMMSLDDDSGTREACFAHGAHAFVGKSKGATELLPAIFRLFNMDAGAAQTASGAA